MRSLQYFPVQLFAVVMGLSGLTIAYAKAFHFLHLPYWPYFILLILDTAAFFCIFITYMIKWIKYPDAIKAEINHPVKSSFIPAISISFLLISIAYMDYAPTISVTFWWIGAWLHLFFTFSVIKFWIRHSFDVKMISPAWFIPIVGNVLVPVAGVDVVNEYINLFFFTLGIFYWIVLFTIVTYRMIFHHPLPKKLIPTFFILIAPPAVGFISYFRITFGSIDIFSMILYLIGLFTFLLLIAKKSLYTQIPFFISWWAYTFPLAAITIATTLIYSSFKNCSMYWFSLLLLAIVTVVVFYVAYKTYLAIKAEKICIPEEE
ncbi:MULTISPECIES: SLAC1 anion channel family protein [unclassified Lebetimonas]|uniref:SLAC1 anion channel family protein n=1 Tax=unclassified Lebetimonas TaxID=2648158 RepID=UPI0004668490|nr:MULTISPECIES: SLAC1 anion channel family protein [unclassified Lebetimonas]